MSTVRRFDTSRAGKAVKTPQGFLRIPARPTRAGVLEYARADGSIRRELRHPDDVFHADSLATLQGAPVTHLHPPTMVDPTNVREYKIGQVSDASPRRDGMFVDTAVTVETSEEIAGVDTRDLVELSSGYVCKIDPTPGVWDGPNGPEHYDCRQIEIRYNHVALGPSGWGRAGNAVALRLDSQDAVAFDVAHSVELSHKSPDGLTEETPSMEFEIRVDGVAVKVPEAVAKHVEAQAAKISTLEKDLGASETKADELQKKYDAAIDPKAVAALVSARVELESAARKILGDEAKFDGLSAKEIHLKAIAKVRPERKFDGKSDEYIAGAFESLTGPGTAKTDESVAAARQDAASEGTDGEGEGEKRLDAKAEREKARVRKSTMWKNPAPAK